MISFIITVKLEDIFNRLAVSKQHNRILKNEYQKISGVGNYILAEGLYRANIDPFAGLHELSKTQLSTLFHELKSTALESLASQGMTRSKGGSFRNIDGERGSYEFKLQCYGKECCIKGNPIIREINGPHKRTIWYTENQLFVSRSMRNEDGIITQDNETSSTILLETDLSEYITDPTWRKALSSTMSSSSFHRLSQTISKERSQGYSIYPPSSQIFSALNLCPLNEVKVVIVGQDPYHGPNQGHGLAFSVMPGVPIPPSLKNILKEVEEDVGISSLSQSQVNTISNGNLESWAKQGILLLNTVLTVRRGESNSHKNIGWEEITSDIISKVVEHQPNVVFLLWGNPAAKKATDVLSKETYKDNHCIIKCSHPSPLAARRTSNPFLGSRCFSKVNDALVRFGLEPIDWILS